MPSLLSVDRIRERLSVRAIDHRRTAGSIEAGTETIARRSSVSATIARCGGVHYRWSAATTKQPFSIA